MPMMISFLFVSILFGMFVSYLWSSKGALNTLIKMAFTIYTLWAILMLMGVVIPMINSGQMRLL